MRLFIAEKPKMGSEIAAALQGPHKRGDGYIETSEGTVTWCIGHIMELATPEEYDPNWKTWNWQFLPMIPTEFRINVTKDKSKQFQTIKRLLATATEVVNAGDPGREGQLIVDEVLTFLKNKKPVKRILLQSLDNKSVRQALSKLEDNQKYFPLYQAALGRSYADWLMGMNLTRAYTLIGQKNGYTGVLSVGRVQSPTLNIVVKRDLVIENFVSQDYFIIYGQFDKNKQNFKAYFKTNDNTPPTAIDEDGRIKDKQFALDIKNKINGKKGEVVHFEEKDCKEYAPLPFSLSKLQIYASQKWSMSAQGVLDTCQSLYEKKLQSYPRTDCQYLPENQLDNAKNILANISATIPGLKNASDGADLTIKSGAWDDTKIGEHYGLIPTEEKANLNNLSTDEKNVYLAVCERFIAQFYPACEYKAAVLDIKCENEFFRSTGKVITLPGWKSIFSNNNDDDEDDKKDDEEEQVFPDIKLGDILDCIKSEIIDKKTKPPQRFTDGTLIKAMTNIHTLVTDPAMKKKLKEKKGIGQEATRTHIIENLVKRTLLGRKGKNLISSEAARELVKNLPSKVIDPVLTAVWEDGLDQIASSKLQLSTFLEKQKLWVTQLVDTAKTSNINMTITVAPVNATKGKTSTGKASAGATTATKAPKVGSGHNNGDTCPHCKKGKLMERTAKASGKKFLGCNNFPKCNYVEWGPK